eukprot:symbB.v1.2.027766.t1/scaffold2862.1/size68630/6
MEDLETYAKAYEARDVLIFGASRLARLSAMNVLQLQQLRQLSTQLHRYLGALQEPCALTIGGFLVELGALHFDLPNLAAFVQRTELARKVRHFAEKVNVGKALASSSVYALADLLTALQESSAEELDSQPIGYGVRHPREQSGNIRPSLAKKTPPSSNTDAHQKNTGSMKVNDYYSEQKANQPNTSWFCFASHAPGSHYL